LFAPISILWILLFQDVEDMSPDVLFVVGGQEGDSLFSSFSFDAHVGCP
jgi:hypothetical protein